MTTTITNNSSYERTDIDAKTDELTVTYYHTEGLGFYVQWAYVNIHDRRNGEKLEAKLPVAQAWSLFCDLIADVTAPATTQPLGIEAMVLAASGEWIRTTLEIVPTDAVVEAIETATGLGTGAIVPVVADRRPLDSAMC